MAYIKPHKMEKENVMELAECLTCSEHEGEDIKYYCKGHKVPCCGQCIIDDHKTCGKVIDLKKKLPVLLCHSKSEETIADFKQIETHLMKFMEMNESYLDNPGNQITKSTDQIREVRKKINAILDEIEKQVMATGSEVYTDLLKRKQFESHQCLMLIQAVRYAQYLFETVQKHGSNLQKCVIAEKVKSMLGFYSNEIEKKYEAIPAAIFKVEFSSTIESILSASVSELVQVESITCSSVLPLPISRRQTFNSKVDAVDVIDIKSHTGDAPRYTGVTFLSGGRLMLADHDNNQCILLSSSYQFITCHTVTGDPWNICVLDDQEVAVSLIHQNTIQILSVVDDVFRPVRMIPTKYNCNGIAAAGKGEMVVNWYCGNYKSQWSLMNTKGDVKYSQEYDCPFSTYDVFNYCIALNNAKTRVYISADLMDSLLCFDLDGNKMFTYKAVDLTCPRGVDVDRYDNIYVIGQSSNNIHQLSPNGSVIQVITEGVPLCPYAICINKSKDILAVTNFADKTKIYIYQMT